MVFSFFCFLRSFSFIYSSFTLILLISACSRFSFFVPVSRLLPLASVSNPGLLFLRCIYGFPAKDYFCFKNLPAFKLSWLLTDPASAETPLALSFQRFSALKISSAFQTLSFSVVESLSFCTRADRFAFRRLRCHCRIATVLRANQIACHCTGAWGSCCGVNDFRRDEDERIVSDGISIHSAGSTIASGTGCCVVGSCFAFCGTESSRICRYAVSCGELEQARCVE